MVSVGCDRSRLARHPSSNSREAHELGARVFTAVDVHLARFLRHPRAAVIIMPRQTAGTLDFTNDPMLLGCYWQGRRIEPPVVGSLRDLLHAALSSNWPTLAMRLNEPKIQLLSLAKNAVAFFNVSLSIFSCRFSSPRRLSSATIDGLLSTSACYVPSASKAFLQ